MKRGFGAPQPHLPLAAGCAVVFFCSVSLVFALPAFPGAEGYGVNAVGGRGGDVYHVTSLADTNTPGTLRYGINTAPSTGRTIVFDISGTIWATDEMLVERKDNLTIAGQTAPAGGITIAGQSSRLKYSDNIVIRYLRFRPGDIDSDTEDGLWVYGASTTIVDHCSLSWSIDEVLSMTGKPEDPEDQPQNPNVTLQWCIVAEGLNEDGHGYGSLFRPHGDYNLSVHHCLYEHNWSRNPRPGYYNDSTLNLDFRNNVLYDWSDQAGYNEDDGSGQVNINYAGNYLIAGPDTKSSELTTAFTANTAASETRIYQSGNKIDGNRNGTFDGTDTGWGMFDGTYAPLAGSFSIPGGSGVYTQTADAALASVLAGVGASLDRDTVDQRLITDVYDGTGGTINSQDDVGGWPTIPSVTRPGDWDPDQDGMPTYWELELGLDPNVANHNGDHDGDGYTNLEEYLNEIGAFPSPAPIVWSGGVNRYELSGCWESNWQPSRFDTVEVNTGRAVVSYRGQDAGTLLVGNAAGQTGELYAYSGELAVAEDLVAGNAAGAKGVVKARGTLTVGGDVVLAAASASTGELVVYKDTHFEIGGLTIHEGAGRSGKVTVRIGSDGHGVIHTTDTSTLGGLLEIRMLEEYRPREGDTFTVIASTDPNGVHFVGDFADLESYSWRGLPAGLEGFGGGVDGASYVVFFQGYTYGDANGDHAVNGGDLALMGGSWMKTGQNWATCDFDGDGKVDGGDLALMGGSWMWELPSPPPPGAIPEPTSLALLAIGSIILARRERPA